MSRVCSIIPFHPRATSATAAALASGSAVAGQAPQRQRSTTIAPRHLQAAGRPATLKPQGRFDISNVNCASPGLRIERNPFDCRHDTAPGFFLSALVVAALLVGIVVGGCILIGVL